MNALTKNIPVTMTSREIAELTGKNHQHVRRDIKRMLSDLLLAQKEYVQTWTDPQNSQTYEMYRLPKDLTITLVSGYRADLRFKIVRRLMALEEEMLQPISVPQTMAEALRLAADQAEQIEAQQKQISISQPKADALDLLSKAHGDLGVQDAGRVLEVGQHWVVDYVMNHGWACRRSKKLRPAHYGLEMGYCRLFTRTYLHRITGEEMATDDFVLTRKGITRLGEIIAKMKAATE